MSSDTQNVFKNHFLFWMNASYDECGPDVLQKLQQWECINSVWIVNWFINQYYIVYKPTT